MALVLVLECLNTESWNFRATQSWVSISAALFSVTSATNNKKELLLLSWSKIQILFNVRSECPRMWLFLAELHKHLRHCTDIFFESHKVVFNGEENLCWQGTETVVFLTLYLISTIYISQDFHRRILSICCFCFCLAKVWIAGVVWMINANSSS